MVHGTLEEFVNLFLEGNSKSKVIMFPAKYLKSGVGEYNAGWWSSFDPKSKEAFEWAKTVSFEEPIEVNVYRDGTVLFSDGHHRAMAGKILDRKVPIIIGMNKMEEKSSELWKKWLRLVLSGKSPKELNPEGWLLSKPSDLVVKDTDIKEAAIVVDDMESQGLALYINRHRPDFMTLLYHPEPLLKDIEKYYHNLQLEQEKQDNNHAEDPPQINQKDFLEYIYTKANTEEIVVGLLEGAWNNRCDAFEVWLSAARHGYGPFLYDLVGGIFTWIMSDRTSVSSSALKIWKWMFEHPNLYRKKPIPKCSLRFSYSVDHPEEKVNYLEYAYSPTEQKRANTKKLANNNKKTIRILQQYGLNDKTIKYMFEVLNNKFYNIIS